MMSKATLMSHRSQRIKLAPEWVNLARSNPKLDAPPLKFENLQYPAALRKELKSADLEVNVALYKTNEFRHLTQIKTLDYTFPARDGEKVGGRVYMPRISGDVLPLCVYFHSGGMVLGNLETQDFECRTLAWELGIVVFSIDYRLAPEYPFPFGPHDCFDGLTWILQNESRFRVNHKRGVLLCGTSAGAQLAASTALQAQMAHSPINITGQILRVPTTMHYKAIPPQYATEYRGRVENSNAPLLTTEEMNLFQDIYGVPESQWKDPLAFPIWADPTLFPPTFVQVNGADPLRDDGLLFENKLRKAAVLTKLEFLEGFPHNFDCVISRDHPASRRVEKAMIAAAKWLLSLAEKE